MDPIKILQVAGFKNSGKTTLIHRLLHAAGDRGAAVSVVKHHGHGGQPELPPPSTDSISYLEHGAAVSVVEGGGMIQLHQRVSSEPEIGDLIQLATAPGTDLVLVEGFKQASYEKIVLVRTPEDWDELKTLQNIVLVVTPQGVTLPNVTSICREDADALEQWFGSWFEGQHK